MSLITSSGGGRIKKLAALRDSSGHLGRMRPEVGPTMGLSGLLLTWGLARELGNISAIVSFEWPPARVPSGSSLSSAT